MSNPLHKALQEIAVLLEQNAELKRDADLTRINIAAQMGLDPITVFTEDFAPGKGRLTLVCYGQAWCCQWNAMSDRAMRQFIIDCDPEYISGGLLQYRTHNKKDKAYLLRIVTAVRNHMKESNG